VCHNSLRYFSETGDFLCEFDIGSNRLNGIVSEDMQEWLPVVPLMYSKLIVPTAPTLYLS
jgi:hypothetical protein